MRDSTDGGESKVLQHVDQVAVCHEKPKQLLNAIQLVHAASVTRRGVWPSGVVMACPDRSGSSHGLTGARFISRVDKVPWQTIMNIPVVYPVSDVNKWRQYGAGKCL